MQRHQALDLGEPAIELGVDRTGDVLRQVLAAGVPAIRPELAPETRQTNGNEDEPGGAPFPSTPPSGAPSKQAGC